MRKQFLLTTLVCVASARAYADDETDAVTIRSRRAPPSETVVGHAEIERTGGVSLADALRPQADVDLPAGGSAGALGRLSLRGSSPEETLVVIDGLRVSARSSALTVAGADPNLVSVALLQRVSILRGPMSALWGANAVAGVVELTTREPVAPRALNGTLQYAAYLSPDEEPVTPPPMMDDDDHFEGGAQPFYGARGQFTVATRERERYFVAGLSGSYTRGWIAGTQGHLFDATVKVGRTYDGGGTAYVWTRFFDSFSGAPSWGSLLAADAFDADDRQARRGAQVVGVMRRSVGARLTLEAGASLSLARTTLFNPDGDSTAGTSSLESRQSSSEVQGRLAWTRESSGVFGDLTFGVDFGHEALDAEGFGPSGATRGGLFARDQRRFGAVTLDVALRLDGDSLYGWFVSPRVALRASSRSDFVRGEVSAGRAYRPPTFGERTWPVFAYATPREGVVGERGNPNLSVERAWGADASLALGGGDRRWAATARGFALYTEDLIRWAIGGDGYWSPTNVSHAWSAGVTAEASVRVHRRVTLVGSAFWQTTRDERGDEVMGRLRSKVVGRVVWYARTGLRAWVEGLWFDRSGTDGRGEPWRGVFVNARVGWQLASGVGAFVLGENLLDTRFESVRGLPTPGRVVWAGLAMDIDED